MCLLIQAHMLVCRALSNMLLLPWPNLPENEQQWQTRSSNHASLLAALTRDYRILRGTVNITPRQPGLDNSQYFFSLFLFCFVTLDPCFFLITLTPFFTPCHSTPVKVVMQQTLPVLRDIVDSISGESTKSRQICYQSLQESVQVSLSLFPVFIQQPGQWHLEFVIKILPQYRRSNPFNRFFVTTCLATEEGGLSQYLAKTCKKQSLCKV